MWTFSDAKKRKQHSTIMIKVGFRILGMSLLLIEFVCVHTSELHAPSISTLRSNVRAPERRALRKDSCSSLDAVCGSMRCASPAADLYPSPDARECKWRFDLRYSFDADCGKSITMPRKHTANRRMVRNSMWIPLRPAKLPIIRTAVADNVYCFLMWFKSVQNCCARCAGLVVGLIRPRQ